MAHIHELIDWTAGVYIVYNNKVLIRLHEKYGIWIHVGGHVELDEDPAQAAVRECREEVGLDVEIHDGGPIPPELPKGNRHLPNPAHMNIHCVGDKKHQHIDLLYYATSETDHIIPENPGEQSVWLTKEEVERHPNMEPQVKFYALGALEALKS
ncbi:MAG: 8-oxo-dGTP pyrophosphatase MutT (NUDIX family) [Acidimicrobiales bacterium]|jgi:8-oxo-dGTP pyrophosphatase MutT (NUDIX family)